MDNPLKTEMKPNLDAVLAKLHEEGLELACARKSFLTGDAGHTISEALDVIGCFIYAIDHMSVDDALDFVDLVQYVAEKRDMRNKERYQDYEPQAHAVMGLLRDRFYEGQ